MRPRLALLVAVVVLAIIPIAGWGLLRANHETGPVAPWDSYRLTAAGIEVYKLLRPCDRVTGVDVEESDQRVEITLHVDSDNGCQEVATPTASRVELAADLGPRRVYDGACLAHDFATSLCERAPRHPATR